MSEKELRELDAWIAEHVTRWRVVTNPDAISQTKENWIWNHPKDGLLLGEPWELGRGNFDHQWRRFQPTTNPTDAMEVLKKCAEKVNGPIEIHQSKTIDGGPWCVCHMPNYDIEEIGASAETLELAVCLFAKKLFSIPKTDAPAGEKSGETL